LPLFYRARASLLPELSPSYRELASPPKRDVDIKHFPRCLPAPLELRHGSPLSGFHRSRRDPASRPARIDRLYGSRGPRSSPDRSGRRGDNRGNANAGGVARVYLDYRLETRPRFPPGKLFDRSPMSAAFVLSRGIFPWENTKSNIKRGRKTKARYEAKRAAVLAFARADRR